MTLVSATPLFEATVSIFVFLALCAALVLITIASRRPTTTPLAVATGLVVVCLAVVAVVPYNVPIIMGVMLAALGIAVSVLGGNPIVRQVLALATAGRVTDGAAGGIIVTVATNTDGDSAEVMRGGATIGYLERLAITVSVFAGFPEGVAVVVAIKGIGRFSELATAEARERFIIGTLASMTWAAMLGALIHLAI